MHSQLGCNTIYSDNHFYHVEHDQISHVIISQPQLYLVGYAMC